MQQLKRVLLRFYVTIVGHFKGKSPNFFFRRLWKGKTQVFEAPTGYSTVEEAFNAFLCDNIWSKPLILAKKCALRNKKFAISKVF